jgi:polyisoprenoid-binding protein YceI
MTARQVGNAISPAAGRICFLLCCVMLAFNCAAGAQQPGPLAFHLDPATTKIHWTLNTTVHTVHGTFQLKAGQRSGFNIDPATGDASGLIVIDATSGESGDSARDKRMHAAVLDSAQYPLITFRPTHIDGKIDLANGGPVTVIGILNLHGQNHPLTLTVALHPQGRDAALTAHFSVPFVAWGLKDPSSFIFRTDKQVTLDVDAVALPDMPVGRAILRPGEVHTGRE